MYFLWQQVILWVGPGMLVELVPSRIFKYILESCIVRVYGIV
jgi:hypothetical protein